MAKEKENLARKEREHARRRLYRGFGSAAPPGLSGWCLRKWRINHALSQKELAALFDVGQRTIIRWEKAEAVPKLVALTTKFLK